MKRVRAAVLISGRGSNMMALIEAAKSPGYPAEIACVIANTPDAAGLASAAENGIDTLAIDHKSFKSREAFDEALHQALVERRIEIVALAGFMRILTPAFIARWQGRLINIHPSLLPAYRGLHTHERALADGAKLHGCTVHHVTAELDAGPVILQARVAVLPDDTPQELARRVLGEEHRIYPEALAKVARDQPAKTST